MTLDPPWGSQGAKIRFGVKLTPNWWITITHSFFVLYLWNLHGLLTQSRSFKNLFENWARVIFRSVSQKTCIWAPMQYKKMHPLEIWIKSILSSKCMYLSFKKIKKGGTFTQGSNESIYFGQILVIFKELSDLVEIKILL